MLTSNAHVTQGQFIKLIGALANDKLMTFLEAHAASFTDTTATDQVAIMCRAILRVINKDTGFDLDNPEFIATMAFCVQVGAMTPATQQGVLDYVTSIAPSAPAPVNLNLKKYTLAAPAGVTTFADYAVFLTGWCIFNSTSTGLQIDCIGEFSVDGECTHPAAREVF